MTDIEQLFTDARERLDMSRLGSSTWREADKDLAVIRRLSAALAEAMAQRDRAQLALRIAWGDWDDRITESERERDALQARIDAALEVTEGADLSAHHWLLRKTRAALLPAPAERTAS